MAFKIIPRFKFMRSAELSGSATSFITIGKGKNSFTQVMTKLAKEFSDRISMGINFPPELEFLMYQEYGTGIRAEKGGGGYYRIPDEAAWDDEFVMWPDPFMKYPQYHNLDKYGKEYVSGYMGFAFAKSVMHPGVYPTHWLSDIIVKIKELIINNLLDFMFKNYKGSVPDRAAVNAFYTENIVPKVIELMAESIARALPGKSLESKGGDKTGAKLEVSAADYFRTHVQFLFK